MVIVHFQLPSAEGPRDKYFLGESLEQIKGYVTGQFGPGALLVGVSIHEPEKHPELKSLISEIEAAIKKFQTQPHPQVTELSMPNLPPHLWSAANSH